MKNGKKRRHNASQKLIEKCGIPLDMTIDRPYIRMCSNREIIVEDAGKLVHYDEECVKVMQKRMCVSIKGDGLRLICLANNDLKVTGFILCVSFE